MIRSFVAVDLDPSVLRALSAVQDTLREVGADVRWVRPQGMHLTLKFLGSVDEGLLDGIHGAIVGALADFPVLTAHVCGLGGFPNLRRPRVLWAGVQGEGLAALAQRIDVVTGPFGFEPEQRSFSAHITLGRVNSPKGWPALENKIRTHAADYFGDSRVFEVCLYRSTPQSGGSVYTLLSRAPLGAR